jgi:DNA-binding FrmR family transcriptional regulator
MEIMDDYRQQQIEALQVAHEYSAKLVNGITNVTGELRGNRLLDTDRYLDEVVKGINWVIEIVNRTMDVINEKEVRIEKEQVNESVKALGDALSKKDDALIADALEGGVLEFIRQIEKVTAEY